MVTIASAVHFACYSFIKQQAGAMSVEALMCVAATYLERRLLFAL